VDQKRKAGESESQAAIAAIRNRKDPAILQSRLSAGPPALRKKLVKQLQPVFAQAGLNAAKINEILAEHQNELRSALEKEKSKSAEAFSALNASLRRGIENQVKALQAIDSKPFIITPITLWTAQIFADPAGMLVNSGAEPGNNWAKAFLFENADTGTGPDGSDSIHASVFFYFFWQNQSDYLAVLNANSGLAVQGTCQAATFPDFLSGGSSSIGLYARLSAYVGGGDIYVENQIGREIAASSWPVVLGGSAASDQLEFVGGFPYPLSISHVWVESGQYVVFEVRLFASYKISGGSISLDFSEGDNQVMCPFLNIELLTAPTVVGVQSAATEGRTRQAL
jgi:hypothetical protein